MIGDIMLFARPPQPRPVIQNLAAVVEEVCGAFAAQAGRKQLQIDCSIAPALTILADAAQIRVLLSELLRNALDAAVPRGRIVLEGGQIVDSGRAFARLTIADDGRGIPDAVLPHLFDPFFSGRQAGRGLGFGLAKAWRIATLHAATLTAESPADRGAVFTLKWPLES
ncbi:MAG: sensor histidine kinase [Planctomycetaceae bacterium]|nr:MAG: sensor histidine kinase [Planctomycetaceae bacterium]